MIRVDEEDHQVLVTFETVGVRGAFAVRPWVSKEDLRVAIEDLAKECGRAMDVAVDVDTWELSLETEPNREQLVTDGGHEMAPSMEGIDDEMLHVPDRFRKGGHLPGKDVKRARLVDVETPHPGPDRKVLEIHTEDGVAYRYQRYGSSEDFTWFHWQRPGQDPREKHPNIPYGIEVYVGLINGKGLGRVRPELQTIPALDPEESRELRTDGGREPGEPPEDWDPEPASLRDGEHADVSAHTRRNLEQIREAERAGVLNEEEAENARERILDDDRDCVPDGGQQTEPDDDQQTFYNLREANETNTVGRAEFDHVPTSSMLTRFNTHILRRAILEFEREYDQRDVFLRQYRDPNDHPAIAFHAGPATSGAIVAAGMIHPQAMTDGGQKIEEQVESLKEAVGAPGRKRGVVELSLRDALEASDDREVNSHIRQALQLLDADREGIR